MVIYRWDPNLEIGIPLLDQQHREIMEYCNAFFIAHKCNRGPEKCRTILDSLERCIISHFQTEEAYQLGCDYPRFAVHQSEHSHMRNQLKRLRMNCIARDFDSGSVGELYEFLTTWISRHTLGDDVLFAQYYRSRRGNSSHQA